MSILRYYKLNGNVLDSTFYGHTAKVSGNAIKPIWSKNISPKSSCKLPNGYLICSDSNGYIYAYNPPNGQQIWSTKKVDIVRNENVAVSLKSNSNNLVYTGTLANTPNSTVSLVTDNQEIKISVVGKAITFTYRKIPAISPKAINVNYTYTNNEFSKNYSNIQNMISDSNSSIFLKYNTSYIAYLSTSGTQMFNYNLSDSGDLLSFIVLSNDALNSVMCINSKSDLLKIYYQNVKTVYTALSSKTPTTPSFNSFSIINNMVSLTNTTPDDSVIQYMYGNFTNYLYFILYSSQMKSSYLFKIDMNKPISATVSETLTLAMNPKPYRDSKTIYTSTTKLQHKPISIKSITNINGTVFTLVDGNTLVYTCNDNVTSISTTKVTISYTYYLNTWGSGYLVGGITGITAANTMAILNGIIYIGDTNGNVYGISNKDGSLVWKSKVATSAIKKITINNKNYMFVSSEDNSIYEFDLNDNYLELSYYTDTNTLLNFHTDLESKYNIFCLYSNKLVKYQLSLTKESDGIIGDYCYRLYGGNSNILVENPYTEVSPEEFSFSILYSPVNYTINKSFLLGGTDTYHWKKVVRSDNGIYVAISTDSNICAYSTDGKTWVKSTLPSSYISSYGSNFTDIIWLPFSDINGLNGIKNATGYFAILSSTTSYILISANGITWYSYNIGIKESINKIYYFNLSDTNKSTTTDNNYTGSSLHLLVILTNNSDKLYYSMSESSFLQKWSTYFELPATGNWLGACCTYHYSTEDTQNIEADTNILLVMEGSNKIYNVINNLSDYIIISPVIMDTTSNKLINIDKVDDIDINWTDITYAEKNNIVCAISNRYVALSGLSTTNYSTFNDFVVYNLSSEDDYDHNWNKIIYVESLDKFFAAELNTNSSYITYSLTNTGKKWYLKSLNKEYNYTSFDYINSKFLMTCYNYDNIISYDSTYIISEIELPIDGTFSIFFDEESYLTVNINREYYRCNFKSDYSKYGKWYNLIITYNSKILAFYVNGELRNHFVLNGNKVSFKDDYFKIGDSYNSLNSTNSYQFFAKVNDFKIFDHALTLKEVNELGKICVLSYKFNDNTIKNTNAYRIVDPNKSRIANPIAISPSPYMVYDCSSYMHNLYISTNRVSLNDYSDSGEYYTFYCTNNIPTYMYMIDNNFYSNVKQFTLSFWFCCNNVNKDKVLISKCDDDFSKGWSINFIGGVLYFTLYNGFSKYQINYEDSKIPNYDSNGNKIAFNYTQWHHYVVIYDSGLLNTFVDGISEHALTSTEYVYSTNNFMISSNNLDYCLNGDMLKDIRLYHSVLTVNDIKELYNKGSVFDYDDTIYSYSITENNNTFEIQKDGIHINTITESNSAIDELEYDTKGNIVIPSVIIETY